MASPESCPSEAAEQEQCPHAAPESKRKRKRSVDEADEDLHSPPQDEHGAGGGGVPADSLAAALVRAAEGPFSSSVCPVIGVS